MTSTAHDGKLVELDDDKVGVRFERRLAHPPERVWRAITDPEELATWFPDTIEGEFAPGTEVTFPKFADMGLPATGSVTEFDPPRLLAFTWGTSTLRFELECLEKLEARLAGADPAEPPQDHWSELHDAYAAKFGVDPEVGRKAMREYQAG